jgi:hypothetical protein
MTKRIREGVAAEVNERMDAVDADVLSEDNMLFRVCAHSVRHPVGHLTRTLGERDVERHHVPSEVPGSLRSVPCCAEQCCAAWRRESVA